MIARMVLLTLLLLMVVSCSRAPEGPVVKTASGEVQGFIQEGVHTFYGIPYAMPPVGDLRWQPPHEAEAWQGILQAVKAPNACYQYMLYMKRGEEDCLYLNIWTPSVLPLKPLPVMVWFHGGGFIGGDGIQGTESTRLAGQGDVVSVSMNYRVGPLGFLSHPALTAEQGASGNYGIQDQRAALQWVKANIAQFGGDPENITIFGESAGGWSVCLHMISPESAGLFDKAIIQSGPCNTLFADLSLAEQQGLEMEKRLGCEGDDALACMRSQSPERLIEVMPNDPGFAFGEGYEAWMPVIDKKVLTRQFAEAFDSGKFNQVPVINGANGNEGNLLIMFSHNYRMEPLDAADYEKRLLWLAQGSQEVADALLVHYPLSDYAEPALALSEAFGDGYLACQSIWASEHLSQHVPVDSYIFNYKHADFILPELIELGAFHSAELQFVFNRPMAWFENRFSGDELLLSEQMMGDWTRFAYTGNPNKPDDPHWPLFNTRQEQLFYDLELSTQQGWKDEDCNFWRSLDFGYVKGRQQG
ncbi:MAG: carboxylesterase family protein [Pseudomonadales bacterium]|nr:carboxylesterase family protein [Pseudomonadales bacterium]